MNMALAGLVILVLGDSHMAGSNYLISPLHDALVSDGASVHSYGMCGASADAWLNKTTVSCGRAERHDKAGPIVDMGKQAYTWQINELIVKHHPNLVIVEAADAMAGYGSPQMPRAWIYEQTHALVGRIQASGAACVWVGPVYGAANSPYHKDDQRVQEVSQFLSQSVAPCKYVDSTRFAPPGQWPTTDGQHLTPAGYKAWGQNIANAVAQMKGQFAIKQ
jgi:hypothetical protein